MRFASARLFAAATAAAAMLASPSASAYCRTTTTAIPVGYNPVVSGCITTGTPLAWAAGKAPYGVAQAASKQVTLAEATAIADKAFAAWNNASCEGGPPTVQAYDDGPIAVVPDASDCQESNECSAPTHDVISFDDDTWPYDDPANTLALTTVTYGQNDGRIFEAKTEVNSAMHKLTTTEPPPKGDASYDLQAILTHEAGHFLGMAHATETTSIMYAYYQPGAITLTADDIDGICAIYPIPPPSKGCSLSVAPGDPSGPWTVALGGATLFALVVGRALRRASRRGS